MIGAEAERQAPDAARMGAEGADPGETDAAGGGLAGWFKADHFLEPDFDADSYVAELRRYVPLDTLHQELDRHLAFLKNRLVEVINEDYNDFVSLSTKLVDVDGAVLRMKRPLLELRGKLEAVQAAVQGEMNELNERLKRRTDVAAARDVLDLMQDTAHVASKVEKLLVEVEAGASPLTGADLDSRARLLERVASEVSRLNFYCNKGKDLPFIQQMQPRAEKYCQQLNGHLQSALDGALQARSNSSLFHCLHAYSSLGNSTGAEAAVAAGLVAPLVARVVAAHSSTGPRQGADTLASVFAALREELESGCGYLLDIALNPQSGLHSFNFLGNSVLKEVHAALAKHLSRAFSPGVPAAFLANYHASMKFLEGLEGYCRSLASVEAFRGCAEYTSFMKRWNLSVYFSLRFQDIAGKMDTVLTCTELQLAEPGEKQPAGLHTAAAASLWSSLHWCLSSEVYVDALAERFVRLTLQLLGRFHYWLSMGLKLREAHASGGKAAPAKAENLCFEWAAKLGPEQMALLRSDVSTLVEHISAEFTEVVRTRLQSMEPQTLQAVLGAVQHRTAEIAALGAPLTNGVAKVLADRCVQVLKQLRGITATYRATRRPMPTRPSHYVASVLTALRQFLGSGEAAGLSAGVRGELVAQCAEAVSLAYAEMVDDLLVTVRKTEDSLKRLKKGRSAKPGATPDAASDAASDQEKICMQLFLDVQEYGRELRGLELRPGEMAQYKRLWAIVAPPERAEQISFDPTH